MMMSGKTVCVKTLPACVKKTKLLVKMIKHASVFHMTKHTGLY